METLEFSGSVKTRGPCNLPMRVRTEGHPNARALQTANPNGSGSGTRCGSDHS
jgi:hypothetical protein